MGIIDELNGLDIEKKKERIQKVLNQGCSLSIKKSDNGGCEIEGEGNPITILATLTAVRMSIFQQYGIDQEMFEELLKSMKIIISDKKVK